MAKPTLFVLTDELQHALEQLPPDRQRGSRLEPLKPFILRWRRQGRTYRRIAEILTTECKLPISHIAVRKFVKRCARPRKQEPEPEAQREQSTSPPSAERVSQVVTPTGTTPRRTPEEIAAARAAMRAAYDQPLFPQEENKPLFVRRPGPIRNLNNETRGDK